MAFLLLNEHAGHRFAASAVVVDETTGGTSDFPGANRNRSGSSVGCGFVEAFDGKAGTAFVAHETERTSRSQSRPLFFSDAGSRLMAVANGSARGDNEKWERGSNPRRCQGIAIAPFT